MANRTKRDRTVTAPAPVVTPDLAPVAALATTEPSPLAAVVTTAPVRPLPIGFDDLAAALRSTGVNTRTDMAPAALRADIALVVAAMESAFPASMPPRGRGRWTGLRTYDFQNTVFFANARDGWRFSDRTLAILWAAELASNACDFAVHARYVGSTRTDYRNGRHGSNVCDPTNRASVAYVATTVAVPAMLPTETA